MILYKTKRCFYFRNIRCVEDVVIDLYKYIMIGIKCQEFESVWLAQVD